MQAASHCQMCNSANQIRARPQSAVGTVQPALTATPANASSCQMSADAALPSAAPAGLHAFPTEQKIAQRLRAQQLKELGAEESASTSRRKKKVVEQHLMIAVRTCPPLAPPVLSL